MALIVTGDEHSAQTDPQVSARGKRAELAVAELVLPYFLVEMSHFCDRETMITVTEKRLENLTFDATDTPWGVTWTNAGFAAFFAAPTGSAGETGAEGAVDAAAWMPELYNTPFFKQKLRRFLAHGRNLVRRFGFCAYWFLRGRAMSDWYGRLLRASPAELAALELPYGILSPDQALFWRVGRDAHRTQLKARSLRSPSVTRGTVGEDDADLLDKVDDGPVVDGPFGYAVFDDGAEFGPTSESVFRAGMHCPCPENLPALRIGRRARLLTSIVPRTAFWDLMQRAQTLAESRTYHMDAEFVASQPQLIYQAPRVDLRRIPPEQLGPGQLFQHETLAQALLAQAEQEELYNLADAAEVIGRQQQAIFGRARRADTPSLTEQRRRFYSRPSPFEQPQTVPPDMTLAHVHSPGVINDLETMENRYMSSVAAAMNVPLSFVQAGMAGGDTGGSVLREQQMLGGARAVETRGDRDLEGVIKTEQRVYQRLFAHVYATAQAPMDLEAFSEVHAALQQRADELKDLKRVKRQLISVLGPAPSSAGGDDDDETTASAAAESEERRSVRDQKRRVAALLTQLQYQTQASAALVFQRTQTHEAQTALVGLLEVAKMGYLAASELQPAVQAVYGKDVRLREPPEPAGAAAPSAPPKKKKKKKAKAAPAGQPPAKRAKPDKKTAD